jgi:hypothetical protein
MPSKVNQLVQTPIELMQIIQALGQTQNQKKRSTWSLTHCMLVVAYRRFRTAYRPHLQESSRFQNLDPSFILGTYGCLCLKVRFSFKGKYANCTYNKVISIILRNDNSSHFSRISPLFHHETFETIRDFSLYYWEMHFNFLKPSGNFIYHQV